MGNQKFKLSDMIPNAWFFKRKDMTTKPPCNSKSHSLTKPKKHRLPPPPPPSSSPPSSAADDPVEPPQCQPRKSYHVTRDLTLQSPQSQDPPLSPPRKSKSRKSTARRGANSANHHRQFSPSSSVSTTCTCRTTTTTTTVATATDMLLSPAPAHHEPPQKPERFDIVIDVSESYKVNGFDLELPRIVTKPAESTKPAKVSPSLKDQHRTGHSPPSRRFSVSSPAGVRLKINSPKIMARKQGQNGNHPGRRSVSSSSSSSSLSRRKRQSISESFAVVKSSRDPQKDFRESMVEMIVQNNLKASKDLEDLLACYLSLNSDEYHDVIINVFKQIWFDLIHLRHQKLVS